MKIPVGNSGNSRVPRLFSLKNATMSQKAGPRESIKKFLGDLRTIYESKKKSKLPKKNQRRQFSIGYFIFAFFGIMLIQNYYGRAPVELISYSEFKSLLRKEL